MDASRFRSGTESAKLSLRRLGLGNRWPSRHAEPLPLGPNETIILRQGGNINRPGDALPLAGGSMPWKAVRLTSASALAAWACRGTPRRQQYGPECFSELSFRILSRNCSATANAASAVLRSRCPFRLLLLIAGKLSAAALGLPVESVANADEAQKPDKHEGC